MASQSVRIVGLLMLSWKLRRLGAKRLEVYALWLGLLVVLGALYWRIYIHYCAHYCQVLCLPLMLLGLVLSGAFQCDGVPIRSHKSASVSSDPQAFLSVTDNSVSPVYWFPDNLILTPASFWPVALTLSGVVMFLEIYVAVRLFFVGTPKATTWLGTFGRVFSIEVARPMSLFVLDAATVVQAAVWVDSLAQFVPFSLASLLVIGKV